MPIEKAANVMGLRIKGEKTKVLISSKVKSAVNKCYFTPSKHPKRRTFDRSETVVEPMMMITKK